MPATSPRSTRRRYAPRLPLEERKEQVLDATLRLITREGYAGVTMDAVASEAGVAKPVVYDAVGNRGQLLRALQEREEARALADLADVVPVMPPDADPDKVLVDAFEAFLRTVQGQPDRWRLILLPVEGTPESLRRHVERQRRAIGERIQELVAWGIERRGGPEWADPEIVARAIQTLGEDAARLVLTEPDRFSPERIIRVVEGLLADVG
jgi:AcrR family transcriptional regulator